jgi:hypothetical protein
LKLPRRSRTRGCGGAISRPPGGRWARAEMMTDPTREARREQVPQGRPVGISRPSDHRYRAETGNLGAIESFRAQRRAHARSRIARARETGVEATPMESPTEDASLFALPRLASVICARSAELGGSHRCRRESSRDRTMSPHCSSPRSTSQSLMRRRVALASPVGNR